jgi:predicted short-subunit dehydrogenase-like oxidoreductase (DUF2520 family)
LEVLNKIGFIGAGHLAWHLAWRMQFQGMDVVEVWSKTHMHAKQLAARTGASPVDQLADLNPELDLWVLAVPDHAIPEIIQSLPPLKGIIVHTSGTVSIDSLAPAGHAQGVFYPFQSFQKSRTIHWDEIPVFIEGSTIEAAQQLFEMAETLGTQPQLLDSDERMKVHLAGVLANNFSNFLFSKAFEWMEEAGVNPELMLPMLEETVARLRDLHPMDAQTGPARRNDTTTMERHLALLANQPEMAEVYRLISKQLISIYHGAGD